MISAIVCSLPLLVAADPTTDPAPAAAGARDPSTAADAAAWTPPVITSVAHETDKLTLVVKKSEYYFAAFWLGPEPKVHSGSKLQAPAEEFRILGIGNTSGDSVVITAMKYDRAGRGTAGGWIYVDNCPHTYITDIERNVTPLPTIHPPM
jgi:hypothetical protein